MEYILGIDQGGSKIHAVIADAAGRILGMGKSYGACHSSSSLEYAMGAILEASDQALNACGITRKEINAVVGGLTGIDWDYEAALLEECIGKSFPVAAVQVVNDSIIAMRAATRSDRCGILCAGSGLNCAVQNMEECFVYGFYIPDEYQGGWSLGKRAVQAVFDSHMGLLPETTLKKRVLDYFNAETVDKLLFMRVKGQIESNDYLNMPIMIEEEACSGDLVAGNIWKEYGNVIAGFLVARIKKMGIADQDVDIVLSGSIFKCKFQEFQRAVKEEILRNVPNANIIQACYEPVMGAVTMALQKIHGKLAEGIYDNMEKTSKRFPVRRLEKDYKREGERL